MMKNNSPKQVIFCTETDNSQIDDSYVKKLLEVYFDFGTSLKRSFVHMKGKTKYNDKSVIAQIDKKKTDYSKNNKEGKNFVIYVVDADDYLIKYEDQNRLIEIQEYCKEKGYYLVWFCRTIEEVLIGFKVEDNKKLKYAMKFAREANEATIKENDLKCNKICNKKSNFLEVLEEIIRQ